MSEDTKVYLVLLAELDEYPDELEDQLVGVRSSMQKAIDFIGDQAEERYKSDVTEVPALAGVASRYFKVDRAEATYRIVEQDFE